MLIKYYDFKPYIATEYEIKMAKLKADKTISKEELTIQSTIHNGIVNLDELLATKNLNLIKIYKNSIAIIKTQEKLQPAINKRI